ncbi:MAG TPA: alpha/beta hydrolase [Beijerinckiaceae bacterium]|jgi:haloacetate dehalogenase
MSEIDLFPGFESRWLDGEAGRIFARCGGQGEPLVLLHGFPQSHVMWRRVAPALARSRFVVAMDLRGYGWSAAPRSKGGALYAKSEMAKDVVRVMEALGHVRFAVAGHDRGGRVGYRLALDQPGRVTRLALLDILPTVSVWRNIEAGVTPAAHWAFLSRPEPIPEEEIARRGPDAYFESLLSQWSQRRTLDDFDRQALKAYRDAWGDTSRIHAFCEDYRAGAGLDRAADEADLAAGRKLDCPTLVLKGAYALTSGPRPAVDVWRETFAPQAEGGDIDAGHFLAEENPQATLAALQAFL